MEGKAVDAGAAGAGQGGALTFVAKAQAHVPHPLPSAFAKGNALLHRGGHGAG
jgi:hypothetical protein